MEIELCDKCDGSGKVIVLATFPTPEWPDWYGEGLLEEDCPKCEGTGLFPSNPIYCNQCGDRLVLVSE